MIAKLAITDYLRRNSFISVTPRAALIDMDGTLYDSMPSHARAWQRMMSEIGIDVPLEEFFMYEGRTGASTINLLFRRAFGRDATEEECRSLYRRKTELFQDLPTVDPMPGAREFLDFLRETGVRRVLVTGSGQRTLIDRLEHDFPGAFTPDLMITSRDVTNGKPAPEPYLMAARRAGVSLNECMVIENAPLGVEAGHAAGIFTVGVNTGPISPACLADAGADIVYESMPEFAQNLPLLVYEFLTTMNNCN